MKGVICIVTYNRIEPLKKLLSCLSNLKISRDNELDLVISIDYSKDQDAIYALVSDYRWLHGDLTINREAVNLGLKRHVLKCGNLVQDYDYLVLLEDDLLISPGTFSYIYAAMEKLKDENSVAGFSLYSYYRDEKDKLPFIPVVDEWDNYFLQFPSSWGAVYTKNQWTDFSTWLENQDCEYFSDQLVPDYIQDWPKASWKKHLVRYMVREEKYFVYPRFSLSTNPGVDGVHNNNLGSLYSVSLCTEERLWNISEFSSSIAKYDVNFLPKFDLKTKFPHLYDGYYSLGTANKVPKHEYIISSYFISVKEYFFMTFEYMIKILNKVFNKIVSKFK